MKDKREVDYHDVGAYDFLLESQFLVKKTPGTTSPSSNLILVQDSGNGCIQALLTFPVAPAFWKCK